MGLKILVADDEPEILEIMVKRIAQEGFDVIPAIDGQEAWEKIQGESPDVVLLDLNMPKMNGFEVLKALRDHPSPGKWQPAIIISTRGELEDIRKGLSLEAEHYLVKPCSVDNILKAIHLVVKLIPQHKSPSELEDDDIEVVE